jgi:hypothetical protein
MGASCIIESVHRGVEQKQTPIQLPGRLLIDDSGGVRSMCEDVTMLVRKMRYQTLIEDKPFTHAFEATTPTNTAVSPR